MEVYKSEKFENEYPEQDRSFRVWYWFTVLYTVGLVVLLYWLG